MTEGTHDAAADTSGEMVHLPISEAARWSEQILTLNGVDRLDAERITEVLVYAELTGYPVTGLARLPRLVEYLAGVDARPPRIDQETAVSARIDGGNTIGYLTAMKMVELAEVKAKTSGIAAIGAYNTVFTGRNAYYVEYLAEQGLVAMMMNSFTAMVALWGVTEPVFGTNPLSMAMPAEGEVFVYDISTSSKTDADLRDLARRGEHLPEGTAFDAEGQSTTSPSKALGGSVVAFGEHRGSGLALAVQAFGVLAGGGPVVRAPEQSGFFLIAMNPEVFGDPAEIAAGLSSLLETVRSARPADHERPVRVPGDRARAARGRIMRDGIQLDTTLVRTLEQLAPRPTT